MAGAYCQRTACTIQNGMGGVCAEPHEGVEDSQSSVGFVALVGLFYACSHGRVTHNSPRAILTLLQIQEADSDPVTRSAALLSMTCALMSIGYGCVYVVRFGTMKSMYKATRWAEVWLQFYL